MEGMFEQAIVQVHGDRTLLMVALVRGYWQINEATLPSAGFDLLTLFHT
jgi:hypothetical protein